MSNISLDNLDPNLTRKHCLQELSQIYSKIQFLELPQNQFPTQQLHQLRILSKYSIHPVFSSKQVYNFHLKLSEKYWTCFKDLKNTAYQESQSKRQFSASQDLNIHAQSNQTQKNDTETITEQQQNYKNTVLTEASNQNLTEAIYHQLNKVHFQLIVSKTYKDVKKFAQQFDYQKVLESSSIKGKIQLLNSWTPVSCKILNLAQKKSIQTPCKIDSATYLENIKMGKNVSKDSSSNEPTKTIILGKNQSTQMKQIKHMLKVQAKTNFVEEKQKQESKLDQIQKKSIQINYLLNVITKQFFNDFFNDILKIIRQHPKVIEVFCEKILQKVKQEHNFIEIYVQLIKNLTKKQLELTNNGVKKSTKFNRLQDFLVQYLQEKFIKLISLQVTPSCSNFNEYKYQKQMVGICKFIGKLMKERILSKKIFKVCFWEIIYRYVQKVKDNPENDIVNQCLIEAIVTISDSMGNFQLLKLMQKQRQINRNQTNDYASEVSKYEEMIKALVNPSDQDQISRQHNYKNLIEAIKVEDYPHILTGLMQIFGSKRMKLKFLIEQWQEKIQLMKSSSTENLKKLQLDNSAKRQQPDIINETTQFDQDLFAVKKQIGDFIKELNYQTEVGKENKKVSYLTLRKHQNVIRKFFSAKEGRQKNHKIFKLLLIDFFNQFANCKHYYIVQERVRYFLKFVKTINLKEDMNRMLLDIICLEEIENLMIIECDFHFLVDGLSLIMTDLIHKTNTTLEDVIEKIKSSYDPNDDDMNEFSSKVATHLERICQDDNALKFLEQQVYED